MTHPGQISEVTRAFLDHSIEASTFHHAQHVRVAYDLLQTQDFIDAAATYAKGLRVIATAAGVPEKFNVTITYAFMSLIAERCATLVNGGFDRFIADNPDLMSKSALSGWYADDRLHSELARSVFLLPQAG